MKKIVERDFLLSYPNFSEIFIIHTNTRKIHLGGVISQNGKPIAIQSRKLTPAKIKYTTTEIELLSIVETLKELCSFNLLNRIKVHTDQKTLKSENLTTERVLRWRLLLEGYGPEIIIYRRA